jgi:hypothetical protein
MIFFTFFLLIRITAGTDIGRFVQQLAMAGLVGFTVLGTSMVRAGFATIEITTMTRVCGIGTTVVYALS